MQREEKVNLRMHFREMLDGKGHRAHWRTDIFAAVASHQDQFLWILRHTGGKLRGAGMANHPLQGIHHGVTRNEDRLVRDVFSAQKRSGKFGWGEVPVRKSAQHDAVEFLGKWRVAVVRAQTSLHMSNGDLMVKRAQTTHEGACGVTLNNNGVNAVSTEQLPKTRAERRRKAPETLARAHDTEVKIGSDSEAAENLGSHFSVLGSRDREWLKCIGSLQAANHRGQLDGLRTRAHNDGDGFLG